MNYWLIRYDFDVVGPDLKQAFSQKKFRNYSNEHHTLFGNVLDNHGLGYLRSHIIIDVHPIDTTHFVVSKFRLYMPSMP